MHSLKIIILFILILMLLTCSNESDTAECGMLSSTSLKYGIVFNSCGPADAPVVRIVLTDEKISCGESPASFKHISSYLEITNVEDLKVGMVISGHSYNINNQPDPAYECDAGFENCIDVGVLSIEIVCDDGDRLEGKWSVQGSERAGMFIIEKCKQQRPLCG